MCLKHPRSLLQPLRADLERALEAELMVDACSIVKARTSACKEIRTLCQSCFDEELALRKGLHRDVANVTTGKVLKRLLVQIGHIDPSVAFGKVFPWLAGCRAPVYGSRIVILRVSPWSLCST